MEKLTVKLETCSESHRNQLIAKLPDMGKSLDVERLERIKTQENQ